MANLLMGIFCLFPCLSICPNVCCLSAKGTLGYKPKGQVVASLKGEQPPTGAKIISHGVAFNSRKVWEILSQRPKSAQKSSYLLAIKWNWCTMDGSSTIFYLGSVYFLTSHHHLWYLNFKMSGGNIRWPPYLKFKFISQYVIWLSFQDQHQLTSWSGSKDLMAAQLMVMTDIDWHQHLEIKSCQGANYNF